MTIDEFQKLRVGDVVLDGNHRGARREILGLKRISGGKGQRGKTRVCITCTNLKAKSRKAYTIIFVSDETGSDRFERAPKR